MEIMDDIILDWPETGLNTGGVPIPRHLALPQTTIISQPIRPSTSISSSIPTSVSDNNQLFIDHISPYVSGNQDAISPYNQSPSPASILPHNNTPSSFTDMNNAGFSPLGPNSPSPHMWQAHTMDLDCDATNLDVKMEPLEDFIFNDDMLMSNCDRGMDAGMPMCSPPPEPSMGYFDDIITSGSFSDTTCLDPQHSSPAVMTAVRPDEILGIGFSPTAPSSFGSNFNRDNVGSESITFTTQSPIMINSQSQIQQQQSQSLTNFICIPEGMKNNQSFYNASVDNIQNQTIKNETDQPLDETLIASSFPPPRMGWKDPFFGSGASSSFQTRELVSPQTQQTTFNIQQTHQQQQQLQQQPPQPQQQQPPQPQHQANKFVFSNGETMQQNGTMLKQMLMHPSDLDMKRVEVQVPQPQFIQKPVQQQQQQHQQLQQPQQQKLQYQLLQQKLQLQQRQIQQDQMNQQQQINFQQQQQQQQLHQGMNVVNMKPQNVQTSRQQPMQQQHPFIQSQQQQRMQSMSGGRVISGQFSSSSVPITPQNTPVQSSSFLNSSSTLKEMLQQNSSIPSSHGTVSPLATTSPLPPMNPQSPMATNTSITTEELPFLPLGGPSMPSSRGSSAAGLSPRSPPLMPMGGGGIPGATSPRLSSSAPVPNLMEHIWGRREPRKHLLSTGSLAEESLSESVASLNYTESGQESDEESELENFDSDSDNEGAQQGPSTSSSGSKKERHFWEYNVQAKGPKGQRVSLEPHMKDPHQLVTVTDPVFSADYAVQGIKHSGKARKGDGNDLNPNPGKLVSIGKQLNNLNKIITEMTPVADQPFHARPKSRKEKNKLASRACRLKKKAQHEANKIKLYGLGEEHKTLLQKVSDVQGLLCKKLEIHEQSAQNPEAAEQQQQITERINSIINERPVQIAGRTADFVNSVIAKCRSGSSNGGLDDLEKCMDNLHTNSSAGGRSGTPQHDYMASFQ